MKTSYILLSKGTFSNVRESVALKNFLGGSKPPDPLFPTLILCHFLLKLMDSAIMKQHKMLLITPQNGIRKRLYHDHPKWNVHWVVAKMSGAKSHTPINKNASYVPDCICLYVGKTASIHRFAFRQAVFKVLFG